MSNFAVAFAVFLLLSLISPSVASPIKPVTLPRSRSRDGNQNRNVLDNGPSTNVTVYVCQNFDWCKPCRNLPLYKEDFLKPQYWMAPAPGGPGPFETGNYTIGSWGPPSGYETFWVDHENNPSTILAFPGTGHVDPYWSVNVWTWYWI